MSDGRRGGPPPAFGPERSGSAGSRRAHRNVTGWCGSRGRTDQPPPPGLPPARSGRMLPVYRIGGFAVCGPAIWQHSPCAQDLCGMTMTESATDFAVVAYRDDERWEAEVLPVVLTEDLSGLIHTLRQ